MFDDRRRDYVAFGVGQGLLFSADLEPQCKAHVVAQFLGDGRWSEHGALETERERNQALLVGNQDDR